MPSERDGAMVPVSNGALVQHGSYRTQQREQQQGALVQHEGTLPDGGEIAAMASHGDQAWQPPVNPFKKAREEAKAENLLECRNICIFFVFLFIFTAVMLIEQSVSSSRLADAVRGKLTGGTVPLRSVESVNGLYGFLDHVFIPAMYENTTDTTMAMQISPFYHPIDISNRIVGAIRLRQARVQYSPNCQITPLFVEYNISCYPSMSPASEYTGPFGQYNFTRDPDGDRFAGKLGSYGANGFVDILPPSSIEAAREKLAELKSNTFLGPWTRALFIDFAVWNSNIGTYAVTQIVVEFGASGGVESTVRILTMTPRSLQVGGLGSASDWLSFFGVVVVMIFVCWFVFEEAKELRVGAAQYFMDPWNVLDWINMLLLWVAFGMRLVVFFRAKTLNIGWAQLENPNEFQNLRSVAQYVELVKILHAFNAVLLWGKVVKYLRNMPLIRELIETVWQSLDLFMPFLCMLTVAFIGFTMSYNIGFGDKIWELSTFGSAITYLCRAFIRDVKLMPAYDVMPGFGAILILIFYVTFLLVGVNVLFAIIADAMLKAKIQRNKKERESDGRKRPEDLLRKGEPIEELFHEVNRKVERQLKIRAPRAYRYFYPKKKKQAAIKDGDDQKDAQNSELVLQDDWSDDESFNDFAEESMMPTKEELMRSIDHMAGRILSEISIVGIEIKSELHDVCERVAQMLFAVEELTARTGAIKDEQDFALQ